MLYLYITLGVLGGIALIWLFIWLNNNLLETTRYKVKIEGAPKLKIVHLSDLHGKNFSRDNKKLVGKIAAEAPDFIVITGDIIHLYTPKNIKTAVNTVATLREISPVLYVAGNHEMRNKGYRFLRKDLQEAGATVLDDTQTSICGICVVGLNCASLKNDKIFKITPASSPKILLAHEPQFFEKFASAGYDLILTGHAHGGQWRIPFTGVGFYSPGQGLLPKYNSGMHEKGKSKMIISRGLGNSECPVRLFNLPEIVVVDIN